MSHLTKLFLCLMLLLVVVSLPIIEPTHAQTTSETDITIDQHEANVWQAKVEFWRIWEARQRLLSEHTARTWEAKTEFFRDLALKDHIAKTWNAKVKFWRNLQPSTGDL